MLVARIILGLSVVLPLVAAAPAMAVDVGGRLVAGGASGLRIETPTPIVTETRNPLLTSGGFSLGTVATPTASSATLALPFSSDHGNLAVGGYVAYGLNDTTLSSSLSRAGSATRADIAAAYAGSLLGVDGVAALKLGAAWAHPQGFSPNPMQPASAFADPYRASADVNLSLSLTHQVTPSLSLGGVAEASRPNWLESSGGAGTTPGFMLGAGMGYRF
jgi:hypothetical protein